jgi:hypothetical protein
MDEDRGIPWLTDPQRDFLAHLTVVTLLPQMQKLKPDAGYTYQRMQEALGDIAEAGMVSMRADDDQVWVIVHGQSIVHAERDWLEWATEHWHAATSN